MADLQLLENTPPLNGTGYFGGLLLLIYTVCQHVVKQSWIQHGVA